MSPNTRGLVLAVLFLYLLTLLALWWMPAVALHDFSEWSFQARVVAAKLASPDLVVAYRLYPYPVPNSIAIYLMAGLHTVLPAPLVGKLYITFYLLSWAWVAVLFVRRFAAEGEQRIVGSVLIITIAAMSSFFWYGFIGYQTGLLFWVWFLATYRADTGLLTIAAFGVVIFFAHAAVVMQFALLVVLSAVFNRHSSRHLLALLPAGVLTLWYTIGRFGGESFAVEPQSRWDGIVEAAIYKAGMVTMHGPFKNFLDVEGRSLLETMPLLYWGGVISNIVVVTGFGLLALAIMATLLSPASWHSIKDETTRPLVAFSACAALVYLVAPHQFFGLIHIGGRFILPAVIALLALLLLHRESCLRYLAWLAVLVSIATSGAYLGVTSGISTLSDLPMQQANRPPEAAGESVRAYNDWLYRNTRFKYYNYRIYAFSHRDHQQLSNTLQGLSFRTGPVADYEVDRAIVPLQSSP